MLLEKYMRMKCITILVNLAKAGLDQKFPLDDVVSEIFQQI